MTKKCIRQNGGLELFYLDFILQFMLFTSADSSEKFLMH